jgi:NADPH:quinone reductase-like Zn-dependent oxidoreductase
MRAVKLSGGQAAGMSVVELAEPSATGRVVVVRVRAASLNFRDGMIAAGHYPGISVGGLVPLSDGAGEIVAVGDGVTRFKVGERVVISCMPRWVSGPLEQRYALEQFGVTIDGMLADYVVVDEEGLVALPRSLSFEDGACLPCAALTAWTALTDSRPLLPGQSVLTLGTGSVSLFAAQFAKMFGARVISTTSTTQKGQPLKALGVDDVINYRETPDWEKAVIDLTDGAGVDRVVEVGGGNTIAKSVAATRLGGYIGLIGFVAGFGGALDPLSIITGNLTLAGVGMGSRLQLEALVAAMASDDAHAVIDRAFDFEDHAAAYARLAAVDRFGKTIITLS